jgi:hypothetical protein
MAQWWLIEFNEQETADAGLVPGTSQKELYQVFEGTQAQAQAKADLAVNGGLAGPYPTEAAAEAAMATAEKTGTAPAGSQPESNGPTNTEGLAANLPSWGLEVSGLKDWFFRGLMVAGGLGLMAYGISKLLNVENTITEVASKIPVVPV